jgi:hypothetical protein
MEGFCEHGNELSGFHKMLGSQSLSSCTTGGFSRSKEVLFVCCCLFQTWRRRKNLSAVQRVYLRVHRTDM